MFKISFDFDETLSYESVQEFAQSCKEYFNCDLWIVTGRYPDKYNQDVFEVAEKLKIPHEQIIFMKSVNKSEFFKENSDFVFHVDDDFIELEFINEETEVAAIDVFSDSNWKEKCLTLLNEKR